jgi:hypothetical protein
MLSRMLLCSRQKRTTCFSHCVSQSHEQIEIEIVSIRRWKKYSVRFIRLMRICVTKLFSILIKFSCNFKRFLKTRDDSVTQILRSSHVWYSLHAFFHFLCSDFLSSLSIDVCSLCIISLISAQRFLNQKHLRSFDVMSTKRRRRFLDCVSLRLILLQYSTINALCASFCKSIRVLIYKNARWSFMNCICVSTSKNWLSVARKTSLIILSSCFCRSMSLLINIIAMSKRSWNAWSDVAVINDNQFDDDVVHVFNLLEADLSCEDCETSQNEHLSDHFFWNFSHMRFSF